MVHTQGSPGDDLGKHVFDCRAADTISDRAKRGVARVCLVGTKFKTLNDQAHTRSAYFSKTKNLRVPKACSFAVIHLNSG